MCELSNTHLYYLIRAWKDRLLMSTKCGIYVASHCDEVITKFLLAKKYMNCYETSRGDSSVFDTWGELETRGLFIIQNISAVDRLHITIKGYQDTDNECIGLLRIAIEPLIKDLSIEELPVFLTHNIDAVRELALKQIERY